jgi:hypothetical protein
VTNAIAIISGLDISKHLYGRVLLTLDLGWRPANKPDYHQSSDCHLRVLAAL